MEDEDLIDFTEARPAGLHSLRLPSFWVDKPASWFVLAESRFRLHGIHREQTRYDYLVSALTKRLLASSSTSWSILRRGCLIRL